MRLSTIASRAKPPEQERRTWLFYGYINETNTPTSFLSKNYHFPETKSLHRGCQTGGKKSVLFFCSPKKKEEKKKKNSTVLNAKQTLLSTAMIRDRRSKNGLIFTSLPSRGRPHGRTPRTPHAARRAVRRAWGGEPGRRATPRRGPELMS